MKNPNGKRPVFVILLVSTIFVQGCRTPKASNCSSYVDPFIGTANSERIVTNSSNFTAANIYPGAVVPWGMVAISPRNTIDKTSQGFGKIPGGYYFGEKYFYGFGQIHLSGVGCNDWGNILVMPTLGKISLDPDKTKSRYSAESASPGYYRLHLDDYAISAEVSATTRTSITRYTFHKEAADAIILFDLFHNLTASRNGQIRIVSTTEVEGWNENGGFCGTQNSQKVHFVARFSKSASSFGTLKEENVIDGLREQSGARIGAYFRFNASQGETLHLKIGISFVSIANARRNLEAEQPGWDFDGVRKNANAIWESQLSRIKVEGGTAEQRKLFYTALYRALLHPSTYNDVNGEYIAMGNKRIKKLPPDQAAMYTVFSLWDTYRTLHPLMTLVYPERQSDFIKTMIDQYREGGFLPKWELTSDETYVMVGDPALPVIADSYVKGIRDFDVQTAYEAMAKSSTQIINNPIRPGLGQYIKHGYIPHDKPAESVWGSASTSLEYNFADWTLAQLAKSLGRDADYKKFLQRSKGYRHLYDPGTRFLRPRNQDGRWMEPFNPDALFGSLEGVDFPSGGPGFVEGNAWQYLFFVPHDINSLIDLIGKDAFLEKLIACFEKADRFVLFNEPDMSYPYLFNYVEGEAWRTQKAVREAMNHYFNSSPGGYPGNDDCGTVSSWYIFSAMGFYPACPASTTYQIGSPVFDKVTIQLNRNYYPGKTFTIETRDNSGESIYIQSALLNKRRHAASSIDHGEIVAGGTLLFEMGMKPVKQEAPGLKN